MDTPKTPITKIIKEITGKKIKEFCLQELETEYPAFLARLRRNKLYPSEVFYLVWRLNKPVAELFGRSWHELLITDQGGGITEKVLGIIQSLKPQEKQNLEHLLGFEDHVAEVKEKPTEQVKVEYPLTPEEATPDAPEDGVEELKKLFKKTY